MAQRRKVSGSGDGGFSLAEVLVSVAVLGVLGGTVAVNTNHFTEMAQVSACKTDAAVMRTAVAAYRAMHGSMPQSAGDLVPGYLDKTSVNVSLDVTGERATYTWTPACANLADAGTP